MAKTYKRKSQEEKEKEVNELIEKANVGIENSFTTPESLKEFLNYMSKFYNYSLRNASLIQEQFRGALAVGSYAFWKEKGFTVNKGEKGIKILVPNRLSDYFINENGEEVKLKNATKEEKKLIEQGEIEVRKGKLIFNQGYVFEVTQTNAKAEDLPKIFPNKWLDGEVKNYDLMYKAMENIAKKIDVKIIEPKYELGAAKGVSYPLTKEVALNPRNTQVQNIKTLIHELAHAKLHTMETRGKYTSNAKEFQAEMAAYVVCSYFGLDTSEYSFRYISSWTKDVELKDKEKLINEVRETVKEYIEVIEETLINDKELSLSLESENSLEKTEEREYDKKLYEIKEQEVMRNDKELQNLYNEWRELVGRENWCKLQLGGEGVILKHTESEKEEVGKEFSQYAKLENEITFDEMVALENIYEENIFDSLTNLDKLEENYRIDKNKEYETLFDLEFRDGSIIKKGTSFIIEGFENGKYNVHFSAQEGNIYIPDNGTGDMYFFDEVEIERFTDLSKGNVLFKEQVRENDAWKLTDKEIAEAERIVELNQVKEKIDYLMKENYGDFVMAMISIETGINDLDLLDKVYENYMDNDYGLLNNAIDKAIEFEQENMSDIEIENNKDRTVEVKYSEVPGFIEGEKLTLVETIEKFKKAVENGTVNKAIEFTFSLNENIKYNEEFIIDKGTSVDLIEFIDEKIGDNFYLHELVEEYLKDNDLEFEHKEIVSEKDKKIEKYKENELE
ncbi:MAG: ImmA/IrrE family metallo-endopeptidase [Clostridium sp.]|nr:ImmA/IrrE family metallo-endopeptidase [Clostridium sp.]